MNESLAFDAREYQNVLMQNLREAFKSNTPGWLETLVQFIQYHPWISAGIAVLTVLIISAITREILCHYLKTNEILERLKKIEKELEHE